MGALSFGLSMGLGPKLDLDAAAAENQAFIMTRTNERQEMVALNDCLAVYIEKARSWSSAHNFKKIYKLFLHKALQQKHFMYKAIYCTNSDRSLSPVNLLGANPGVKKQAAGGQD